MASWMFAESFLTTSTIRHSHAKQNGAMLVWLEISVVFAEVVDSIALARLLIVLLCSFRCYYLPSSCYHLAAVDFQLDIFLILGINIRHSCVWRADV
jgi:hypothetical protein